MSDQAWLDAPSAQRRLHILVQYEGPFELVMNWLWCLDPETCEIIREVPEGSLRNWLACRVESLDRAWREWHVRRGRMPSGRWARKITPPDDDDRWSVFLLSWLGDGSGLLLPRQQLAGKRLWEDTGGKHRRRHV